MTTFIELHALRSFPPSNLNRDDLGTPKTAIFGGTRRLRISSQCLKRTWRMSPHFRGAFAESQLGIRTERMPSQLLETLKGEVDGDARKGFVALLESIGRKAGKATVEEGDDDSAVADSSDKKVDGGSQDEVKTAHLLFLSQQEVEVMAEFARAKKDTLAKAVKKKGVDAEALKKLRKELEEFLSEKTSKNAVDVGLFGRFVTSDEFDTIDGALQVAHALGTQKVEVEYDYFTAVDDLGETTGAGHLGESEFASSVLYLYACCDLQQLETNLGARSKVGRIADADARGLARRSLPALVRAIAQSTPKGKKTGTAPHTPAEYFEVVVRKGEPLSFANAFAKPVDAREAQGDVMSGSISRLTKHRDRIEKAYGRDVDVVARFILNLRVAEGAAPDSSDVATIEELASKLTKVLDALPTEER